MTPQALADLHALCFTVPRPFTSAEFADFHSSDLVFCCTKPGGFALGRSVVDEAELLTLAVHPGRRRAGLGRALLKAFEDHAKQRGADHAFLEVAADNGAACALYQSAGYVESGRRRGYYRHPGGAHVDAILMSKRLGPE